MQVVSSGLSCGLTSEEVKTNTAGAMAWAGGSAWWGLNLVPCAANITGEI